MTGDSFEETFQVNWLAHLALIDELVARGDGGPGVNRADGSTTTTLPFATECRHRWRTHLPRSPAAGLPGQDTPTDGRQRYTTSKLLITASSSALAREMPDRWVACYDPGLMPGTDLARDYVPWQRVLWNTVGRALVLLPAPPLPPDPHAPSSAYCSRGPAGPIRQRLVDIRLRPAAFCGADDDAFGDQVLREPASCLTEPRDLERSWSGARELSGVQIKVSVQFWVAFSSDM